MEAFAGCTNLASITLPASVNTIAQRVFAGCISLHDIKIPDTVSDILIGVFQSCRGLTNATIGANIIYLSTFYGCTNLETVTLSSNVTGIASWAFRDCTNLKSIYCLGNAPGSNDQAFQNANNATIYYMPDTTGWENTFYGRPTVIWKPQAKNISTAQNQLQFSLFGPDNIEIIIDTCTDLADPDWGSASTITLTNGSARFTAPQPINTPARFYRMQIQ